MLKNILQIHILMKKKWFNVKNLLNTLQKDCLELADWQDLTTILFDLDDDETWIIDNWLEYKLNH